MSILGKDQLESFPYDMLDALDNVVWYNDLGEYVADWKELKPDMTGYIRPTYRDNCYSDDIVNQLEVLWMIAVSMYGDYGTSPRSGWIINTDDFYEFVNHITKTYRAYIGEN